jgi:hypothetical protein
MTSQSVPWTHKPEDLTIRNAVASCNGVTIGRNNIRCRIKYESQILSARAILGFASRYKRPLSEFISSLQVVDGNTRPQKHEDFATILTQAHERKEYLEVYWKDRVMAFEEVIAEGHISLVLSFLWRKRHFITQPLSRLLYREMVMIVHFSLLANCFLVLLLGTYVIILAYLGNMRSASSLSTAS